MDNSNKSYTEDIQKTDTQIKMTCIILKSVKSSYQHFNQTVIHQFSQTMFFSFFLNYLLNKQKVLNTSILLSKAST